MTNRKQELKEMIKELIEEVLFEVLEDDEDEDEDCGFDRPIGIVEKVVRDGNNITAEVKITNDEFYRFLKNGKEKDLHLCSDINKFI